LGAVSNLVQTRFSGTRGTLRSILPSVLIPVDRFRGQHAGSGRRAAMACKLQEDVQRLCEKAGRSSTLGARCNDVRAQRVVMSSTSDRIATTSLHCLQTS